MSNLIITIISIALITVLAIAGIYYGGAAYQNAQAKGIAVAIANQMNQINSAALQWQTDHATGFLGALSGTVTGMGTVLVPSYMQSMIPPDPAEWGGQNSASKLFNYGFWQIGGSDNWGTVTAGSNATYGYFIWLFGNQPTSTTTIQTCKQIAIMARGANALPLNYPSGSWRVIYVAGMNPALDCIWSQLVGSGYTLIDQCSGNSDCWIKIVGQANASF